MPPCRAIGCLPPRPPPGLLSMPDAPRGAPAPQPSPVLLPACIPGCQALQACRQDLPPQQRRPRSPRMAARKLHRHAGHLPTGPMAASAVIAARGCGVRAAGAGTGTGLLQQGQAQGHPSPGLLQCSVAYHSAGVAACQAHSQCCQLGRSCLAAVVPITAQAGLSSGGGQACSAGCSRRRQPGGQHTQACGDHCRVAAGQAHLRGPPKDGGVRGEGGPASRAGRSTLQPQAPPPDDVALALPSLPRRTWSARTPPWSRKACRASASPPQSARKAQRTSAAAELPPLQHPQPNSLGLHAPACSGGASTGWFVLPCHQATAACRAP